MSATTTRLRFLYGCIELQDRGPHIWRPNPHLQMSADEQWKHNERSGLSAGLLRGDAHSTPSTGAQVMKVQTFEEWWQSCGVDLHVSKLEARFMWSEFHKNCSRICESDDNKDRTGLDCAEAIREAAMGKIAGVS